MTTLSSITSQIGLIPSGAVLPFAGTTAPAGWLLCDGSAISQTVYPSLFAAIGSAYDTQINPTTNSAYSSPGAGNFRVPDYRASFLRGTGTPFAGDAVTLGGWQAQKTARNGLNNASSSLSGTSGSMSANSTHGHGISDSGHGHLMNYRDRVVGAAAGSVAAQMQFAAGNPGFFQLSDTIAGATTGVAVNTSANLDHTHSMSGTAAAQNITGDNETRPHNKGVNYIIKI